MQKVIDASDSYQKIQEFLKTIGQRRILLVCGKSCCNLAISKYFKKMDNVFEFSDFHPNPTYESVVKGVQTFRNNHCDMIVAIGGGSALDVSKCIKLYANMSSCENYLQQEIVPNDYLLVAVPTTAGTGSEATRYAVIYYQGEKMSITHDSIIPSVVIFDVNTLDTLPYYERCATMSDALCHALEAMWSINSNNDSMHYAKKALQLILENYQGYLKGKRENNLKMLEAANLSGKAINITKTTAGHAMCYKLTSIYHISHGHAALLCVNKLLPFMINHLDKCIDKRGKDYLLNVFLEIAKLFHVETPMDVCQKLSGIIKEMGLKGVKMANEDIMTLADSVNLERLKNHPIKLEKEDIIEIYKEIGEENESM